ncbi:hypothetical protein TRFO_40868 [Tritrichomonas foetus]|uniref:Uncharacterized protein n=1 Tax=Tritrichomonas foetus TaxID=1144522 RepID=A0A1J4J219_9EUKA|nr:hypothetical protein TRFO_40868 [Tritrichomonas foetus]|eukprot:OHS92809.1 hypothetical protein TRFO_40868 [Tritrichomonas foetus]
MLRVVLISVYEKLPKFLDACLKYNNEEIKEFVSQIDYNLPFRQAVFLSYLKFKTPKWNDKFSEITNEYNKTVEYLNQLISLELPLSNDDYINIVPILIQSITSFTDNYKKCRYMINEIRGLFEDFSPFLDESEAKIKKSISFLKGENPQFYDELYTNFDKEPFIHYAISETLNNQNERALVFLESQLNHFHQLRKSIPDYDAFFDKQRNLLKDLGNILETKLFDNLNTFYYYVRARVAVSFVRSSLADFVYSMIGDGDSEEKPNDVQNLEDSLLRSFQSLKLFCAGMGLKRPDISEEKSHYKPTEEEKDAIIIRQQMMETAEIEENLEAINEGIEEMKKFSSICISCKKYCASYVCPRCYLFLHCLLCKQTNMICPGCQKYFEEPLKINKTCYFGDEFRIELIERQAREKEEEEKAKNK